MKLDIIGDVHGCAWELRRLLLELGYLNQGKSWFHSDNRKIAFVGDIIDRGPDSVGALNLVKELIDAKIAFIAAVGNHDFKIYHGTLLSRPTKVYYGLQRTLDQVKEMGAEKEFANNLAAVFKGQPAFTVFKEDKFIIVHAAIKPEMLEADLNPDWSDPVSQFALYGETIQVDGEPFPRKGYHWVDDWGPEWTVVYGHDVIGELPIIRGQNKNIVGIDTGASYGGRLTAFSWPEKEFLSISAKDVYPEHEADFPNEIAGTFSAYSWEDILEIEHKNLNTLHYLHGKRKTPEMSIPKDITLINKADLRP